MTELQQQPVRRRRDRRAQLAQLAADLFRRHGYHAVGIADIAAAAGITGPAVYRHYPGKQAILAEVLLSGVDCLAATVAEILDRPGPAAERLHAVTEALARLAVERRDAVALWRWLGRHLDKEQQAEVRRRGEAPMAQLTAELRQVRHELSDPDAGLLCHAAMAVFGSAADYNVKLGKPRHTGVLGELARAILASDVVPAAAEGGSAGDSDETRGAPVPDVPVAAPRRELLLTAATRLFRQRGYHAVTLEEIGTAAGIAGPSIYRHFGSKADLLFAAGTRMADRLAHEATRATAGATDAEDALRRLIDSYAATLMDHRDLIAVYLNELSGLSEEQRTALRALQRSYLGEWVRLMTVAHPAMSTAEARVVVHAALTVANDLGRTGRLQSRPALQTEMAGLMRTVIRGCGERFQA
ncbi:MAG: TetR/AcrR family transcriptional regulator [Micromonosporaceae bacterium]